MSEIMRTTMGRWLFENRRLGLSFSPLDPDLSGGEYFCRSALGPAQFRRRQARVVLDIDGDRLRSQTERRHRRHRHDPHLSPPSNSESESESPTPPSGDARIPSTPIG